MSLVKWDPFRELEEVSDRLNRLFGRPLARRGEEAMAVADWAPAVDISETDAAYLIKAELPEVNKDDVKVSLEGGMLTLQGERRQEKEEKDTRYHRIERAYGSFLRSFQLPDNVDPAKVAAEFKDGVLAVTLPKTERSEPKTRRIEVS